MFEAYLVSTFVVIFLLLVEQFICDSHKWCCILLRHNIHIDPIKEIEIVSHNYYDSRMHIMVESFCMWWLLWWFIYIPASAAYTVATAGVYNEALHGGYVSSCIQSTGIFGINRLYPPPTDSNTGLSFDFGNRTLFLGMKYDFFRGWYNNIVWSLMTLKVFFNTLFQSFSLKVVS